MRQHAFNFDRETTRLLERANELTEDASDIWTESLNLLLEHFQKLTEVYLKRDFGEMMAFLVVPPPWDGTTFSVLLAKHARSFVEHGADRWIEPNTKRLEELVKEQGNRYACWADALKLTSLVRSVANILPEKVAFERDENVTEEEIQDAEQSAKVGKEAIAKQYDKIRKEIIERSLAKGGPTSPTFEPGRNDAHDNSWNAIARSHSHNSRESDERNPRFQRDDRLNKQNSRGRDQPSKGWNDSYVDDQQNNRREDRPSKGWSDGYGNDRPSTGRNDSYGNDRHDNQGDRQSKGWNDGYVDRQNSQGSNKPSSGWNDSHGNDRQNSGGNRPSLGWNDSYGNDRRDNTNYSPGFRDDRGQSDGWDRDRDGSSNRDRYRQSSPEPHRRNDESRYGNGWNGQNRSTQSQPPIRVDVDRKFGDRDQREDAHRLSQSRGQLPRRPPRSSGLQQFPQRSNSGYIASKTSAWSDRGSGEDFRRTESETIRKLSYDNHVYDRDRFDQRDEYQKPDRFQDRRSPSGWGSDSKGIGDREGSRRSIERDGSDQGRNRSGFCDRAGETNGWNTTDDRNDGHRRQSSTGHERSSSGGGWNTDNKPMESSWNPPSPGFRDSRGEKNARSFSHDSNAKSPHSDSKPWKKEENQSTSHQDSGNATKQNPSMNQERDSNPWGGQTATSDMNQDPWATKEQRSSDASLWHQTADDRTIETSRSKEMKFSSSGGFDNSQNTQNQSSRQQDNPRGIKTDSAQRMDDSWGTNQKTETIQNLNDPWGATTEFLDKPDDPWGAKKELRSHADEPLDFEEESKHNKNNSWEGGNAESFNQQNDSWKPSKTDPNDVVPASVDNPWGMQQEIDQSPPSNENKGESIGDDPWAAKIQKSIEEEREAHLAHKLSLKQAKRKKSKKSSSKGTSSHSSKPGGNDWGVSTEALMADNPWADSKGSRRPSQSASSRDGTTVVSQKSFKSEDADDPFQSPKYNPWNNASLQNTTDPQNPWAKPVNENSEIGFEKRQHEKPSVCTSKVLNDAASFRDTESTQSAFSGDPKVSSVDGKVDRLSPKKPMVQSDGTKGVQKRFPPPGFESFGTQANQNADGEEMEDEMEGDKLVDQHW